MVNELNKNQLADELRRLLSVDDKTMSYPINRICDMLSRIWEDPRNLDAWGEIKQYAKAAEMVIRE